MVLRATSSLVAQIRIVYSELLSTHPSGDLWSPTSAAALQGFGRRFAAEMYMAAQRLRDQAAGRVFVEDDETQEVNAELQRTLWAVCVWELCVIVFVGRPALLTEALVPWWQLHLCDRRVANKDAPELEVLEQPEVHPMYWDTLRALIAHSFRKSCRKPMFSSYDAVLEKVEALLPKAE